MMIFRWGSDSTAPTLSNTCRIGTHVGSMSDFTTAVAHIYLSSVEVTGHEYVTTNNVVWHSLSFKKYHHRCSLLDPTYLDEARISVIDEKGFQFRVANVQVDTANNTLTCIFSCCGVGRHFEGPSLVWILRTLA